MTFVTLKIYNFKLVGFINEWHAEVTAYGKSWSFTQNGLEVSDLLNKDGVQGYTLVESIPLGFSALSRVQFNEDYLPGVIQSYTVDAYSLIDKNCRHFSLDLIKILGPTREERGLYILSQLNFMTYIIGRVKDFILTNTIRIVCSSPKRIIEGIFNGIECIEQGRFLEFDVFWKDIVLIGLSIVLILFCFIRFR